MKFQITRTSKWTGEQPIPEAKEKEPCTPIEPGKVWLIEVNSLSDMLALVEKYGNIIVGKKNDNRFILEVYDDYRE